MLVRLTTAFFFLLILITRSFASPPQISEIEELRIVTVAENGEYRIDLSFKLGYPFYKCRGVIENFRLYPKWVFNGINELGGSRFTRLTQNNFRFASRNNQKSLAFDYDVRVLFFHFRGNLDISVHKSSQMGKMEGIINGVSLKPTRFVKKFKGELYFRESADGKTSVNCKIFIRPASLVYRVISYKILRRVVRSRLIKICENLNKEIFTRGLASNI